MNDNDSNEGGQSTFAAGISYIDRLVHEVEGIGELDVSRVESAGRGDDVYDLETVDGDVASNPDTAGDDGGDGGDDAEQNNDSDDCSNFSSSDNSENLSSDSSADEFEYDTTDEDMDLEIVGDDWNPASTTRHTMSEESKTLLLWRQDKDESFSDYTIEVSITNENNDKTVYNVHKCALAAGANKSSYFETLFRSGQFSESNSNKSAVEFPEDVAKGFPAFLDYLYSHPSDGASLINRENRRSLQHLAQYFSVPNLTSGIHDFIEEDMNHLEHLEEYLTEFGDAEENDTSIWVHMIAARVCFKMILQIKPDSNLLKALTPAIVIHVMSRVRSSEEIMSLPSPAQYHICELALAYMEHHKESLDGCYFYALASVLYFPDDTKLAMKVAVNLLELMEAMGWEKVTSTSINEICTLLLSRYLVHTDMTYDESAEITRKLSKNALFLLTNKLVVARKPTPAETSIDISCEIRNKCYGKPMGFIVKISIKSTDSVDYIRYLVSRRLNVMKREWGLPWVNHDYEVYCGEVRLRRDQIVADCGISSNSVLEIY